jgi:D-alanyl-D-alanine carboxypeptidase
MVVQPAFAARYASIVVNEETGAVLHAVKPDAWAYPASLTKMMTLYLMFEQLKAGRITLDTALPVSARAAGQPPSKLGLTKGATITVREAIGALITKSANDVAVAIAESLGSTEARFAQVMTARARQLGMLRTTFRNASGLPHRSQVSTARDMAKLAIALRRDFPQYFEFFSMESFKYGGRAYRNHNSLLRRYQGTDGIKTGYVRASGFNLAVSVERHGHRLVGVVFGGKTADRRDHHMMVLLNRTFKMLTENKIPDDVRTVAAARAAGSANPSKPVEFARIAPASGDAGDEEAIAESWSIQVGAFERFAPAHLAAGRAARLAPELQGARVIVDPSASANGRIYRAQLSGLTENRAIRACRVLKQKNMDCLVIRENEAVAEGDQ